MFYEGLRLLEAHLYVFYVSGRLSGGGVSNQPKVPGGSAKERPSPAFREARSVVFYEGLRLWEAHLHVFYESGRLAGGGMSNQPKVPGGSAKERPSRAWGEGEGGEARFVVFYEGLRLWEAHLYVFYVSGRLSGGRMFNAAWRCCEVGCVRSRKTRTCAGIS